MPNMLEFMMLMTMLDFPACNRGFLSSHRPSACDVG